jgi:hypothetical protein
MATCTICSNHLAKRLAALGYEDGLTDVAIARDLSALGISDDAVRRHRINHYMPPSEPGKGRRQRDIAAMVAERVAEGLEDGTLDLRDKNTVPGINAGLKAQALKDKREQPKTTPQAILIFNARSILHITDPDRFPAPQLPDGTTIEGTAVELP